MEPLRGHKFDKIWIVIQIFLIFKVKVLPARIRAIEHYFYVKGGIFTIFAHAEMRENDY